MPRRLTIALLGLAAMGLSACVEGYGYAYEYDPYLGPRGHYVSEHPTRHMQAPCQRVAYSGPYQDGYGGTYYAGPYCLDGGAAVLVAGS